MKLAPPVKYEGDGIPSWTSIANVLCVANKRRRWWKTPVLEDQQFHQSPAIPSAPKSTGIGHWTVSPHMLVEAPVLLCEPKALPL